MHRTLSSLAAVLVLSLILGGPASADTGVDETPLTPGGAVNETNLAGDGMLYISDYSASQVWVVNPATSAYTRYTSAALAGVTDARPASDGRIWFTDAASIFGNINRTTSRVTTWDIDDGVTDFALSGVAFDPAGNVWITESVGTTSKLYRFNPQTLSLCRYTFTGATVSDYLIYHDGFLWLANWYRDRIYRFNPTSYAVTYWPIPAGRATGLAFDEEGYLWWADSTAARLRRLAPSGNTVRSFVLPVGTTPRMLAAGSGLIRYSEYAGGTAYTVGTLGILNPAVAAYVDISTTATPATATESCSTLSAGSQATPAIATGALAWSTVTWTTRVDANGWTVYQAPAGGKPWGVALAEGYVWAADEGRQVLARATGSAALAAPMVTITAAAPDVVLDWDAAPGAATYEVWASSAPYFTPGEAGSTQLAETAGLTYVHEDVLAGTVNYYYYVRSRAGAQTSPVSNQVGKFTFTLAPGR